MSDTFELNAEVRADTGKGASRRLRRLANQVPAIIYGGDKAPQPLTLIRKDLEHALENEAFYSHILTIHVGKKKEKAILKDLQRHPAKDRVMHADFLRVRDMPEYVEVDMLNIAIGDIVHLSDIKLPEGVESVALSHGEEYDLSIAIVQARKGGTEEEEEALEAAAAEEGEEGEEAGGDEAAAGDEDASED
jgi:large subunit ribosomal protein L25